MNQDKLKTEYPELAGLIDQLYIDFPLNVAKESPMAIQPPALPEVQQTSELYPSNLPITDDFWPTEPVTTIEPTQIPTITTTQPTQSTSSAIRIIDLDESSVQTVVTNILKSGCVPSNPDWDISTDVGFELCQESIAYIKSIEDEHPYLWLPDEEEHGFSKRIKCFDLLNVCFAFFKQLVLDPEYVRQNKECQERGDYEFTTRAFAAGIPSSIKCTSLNQLIPALIIDANTYRGIDNGIPKWEMAKYEKRAEKFKSVKRNVGTGSSEPKVDGRIRPKKDTSAYEAANALWKEIIEEEREHLNKTADIRSDFNLLMVERDRTLKEIRSRKQEAKVAMNKLK
jgi:hypothetical protein